MAVTEPELCAGGAEELTELAETLAETLAEAEAEAELDADTEELELLDPREPLKEEVTLADPEAPVVYARLGSFSHMICEPKTD